MTEVKSAQDHLAEAKAKALDFARNNSLDRVVVYQKRGDTMFGYCPAGDHILQHSFIVEIETLVV